MKNLIVSEFKKIGIELDEKKVNQFINYYEMLIEKNKVMNLTAITEFNDVLIKHFIDSVLICKTSGFADIVDKNEISIIDVGTGAGFPGIPLKIVYPQINITLLDSLNKRINFLNEVVDKLELSYVSCIHGRAEDFGHNELYREKFDLCVSRAVANLSTLTEYCIPFVKNDGLFISYKATGAEEEINGSKNAMKILGCKIIDVDKIIMCDLDNISYERNMVIIKKEKNLSKKYPRKSGTPSRNPL